MFAALACGAADTKLDLKSKLLDRKILQEKVNDTEQSEAALDEEEEDICSAGVGAVHQAVLDNNLEKLETLIEDDFPLDERDVHSLTPLHLAVSLGRTDLARALLGGGASPGSRTGPPHKSPLHLAAASANTEIMDLLVKRGAAWRDRDDWGWTVLHEAAASGHQKGIQWVCRESKGLINVPDKLGRSPLLVSLMAGAGVEAVTELLKQGEDPATEDEVGRGAPEAAILYCDTQVIRYVLEVCTNSENKVDINKRLLLEIADDHHSSTSVKDIIEEHVK